MESDFEVTTVQTKHVLQQACSRIMRVRLIVHGALWIAAGIGFSLFVCLRGIESAYSFAVIFAMACVGVAAYRIQSVPKRYGEQTYSEAVKLYREPVQQKIQIYGERLVAENRQTRTVHTCDLKECAAVLESRELLILKTKKKTFFILDKAGFTKGTPEAFLAHCRKLREN